MDLSTRTDLVTGASRGFGRALAAELLGRGAAVYAGARDPGQVDLPGAKPIALDITDPASVAAAAQATGDVTVLINNAGSSTGSDLLAGDLNDIRLEMDTHYFGTLSVVRGFAPQIAANGGGAILNILSGLSWVSFPEIGAYCAAKSAECRSPTNLAYVFTQTPKRADRVPGPRPAPELARYDNNRAERPGVPAPPISSAPPGHALAVLAAVLEAEIRAGQWTPGNAVPSRNQLAERFGIARETAARAHAWLARAGYLVAVPGVGMVVTPVTHWPDEASS